MLKTVLITGANRGIGLQFVRQYADDQWQVIACCRQPDHAKDLQAFSKENSHIRIFQLDVKVPEQMKALRKKLSNTSIDCLINNAGAYGESGERFGTVCLFRSFRPAIPVCSAHSFH